VVQPRWRGRRRWLIRAAGICGGGGGGKYFFNVGEEGA